MSEILDRTLPPDLQNIVPPSAAAAKQEPQGGNVMPENTNALTPEQAKAIATDVVAAKEAERATAARIEALTSERDAAKAGLDQANKQIAGLQAKVAEGDQKLQAANTDAGNANKKIAELEGAKAGLQSQVNKLSAEKVIAERKAKLTEAGLASEDRVNRLTALNQDGTLKVHDAEFDQTVADLKAAFDAGKAATKPGKATRPGDAKIRRSRPRPLRRRRRLRRT